MNVKTILKGFILPAILLTQANTVASAQPANSQDNNQNKIITDDEQNAPPSEFYIFYEKNDKNIEASKPTANIYIDGELQSALKPGDYTRFCLKGGQHSIEQYYNDAPTYSGKRNPKIVADVESNELYYLVINEDIRSTLPVSVDDARGTTLLQQSKLSVIRSRASKAVPCKGDAVQSAPVNYNSVKNVFNIPFTVGRANAQDILEKGDQNIYQVAQKLNANPQYRVIVINWRDNWGFWKDGKVLGERRAQTVKTRLIEQGVPESRIQMQQPENTTLNNGCQKEKSGKAEPCSDKGRRVTLYIVD
ncbi:OmpA family protein [Pantoea sp.]|uniref:OmpA family protein n=1 Tax=Pantoea sp. TaxID=69393 RepID=UPI00289D1198|nr:OmpA family protein [Pantoea sp.]